MKIEGYFLRDIMEFHPCELYIERGKLYRVTVQDLPIMASAAYTPINESEFEIDKIPKEVGYVRPYDCNYKLDYFGENTEKQSIFLKLNAIDIFRVKWASKKYIVQSQEMKSDILKYIIGAIIGMIFTIISQAIINK